MQVVGHAVGAVARQILEAGEVGAVAGDRGRVQFERRLGVGRLELRFDLCLLGLQRIDAGGERCGIGAVGDDSVDRAAELAVRFAEPLLEPLPVESLTAR